jgi:P27 family predicted phage terminase small subunit
VTKTPHRTRNRNMKPGRKPKPTHLKLVTGNPGKRKLNAKEAKVKAPPKLPSPPAHLSDDAKGEWKRVATQLHKAGLLTELDTAVLGAYCQAFGRWVQAERAIDELATDGPLHKVLMLRTKDGNPIQNPLVGIANKAMLDMARYAERFGLDPSARSRIHAEPPEGEPDPADRYF